MKQNTDKNHPQTLDEFLDQIREEAYCKTEWARGFVCIEQNSFAFPHVQP